MGSRQRAGLSAAGRPLALAWQKGAMAMRLNSRLIALEAKRKGRERRAGVRILCHEGETPDEAIAQYEKQHGALGPNDNAIIRVIIHKPFPRLESLC